MQISYEELQPLENKASLIYDTIYLEPERAKQLFDRINENIPNFFSDRRLIGEDRLIVFINPVHKRQCLITKDNLTFDEDVETSPEIFADRLRLLSEQFCTIFQIEGIRRIGRILRFVYPTEDVSSAHRIIQQAFTKFNADIPFDIPRLQITHRYEGKNINIHIGGTEEIGINIGPNVREIREVRGISILCDINNIDISQLQAYQKLLDEILGFAHNYVRHELVPFLNQYLEEVK